ncbi:MAG: transcriptional regulator [Kordiimonadales bacterium]|nr:MAG: transcriptional regulator [Kordiimonadales bacterium]
MQISKHIDCMAALAQETRLQVFRKLVRMGDAGLPAGEIAKQLDVNGTTLSRHLKILERAELVLSERRARHIFYRVNFAAIRGLFEFLLEDCCAGDVRAFSGATQGGVSDCNPGQNEPRSDNE